MVASPCVERGWRGPSGRSRLAAGYRRGVHLTSSTRCGTIGLRPADAWRVVANGREGPRWYVDAAPLVFRSAVDKALGGRGADTPPPGRPLLRTGDRAGFWEVLTADGSTLELLARVRVPGEVRLQVDIDMASDQDASTVTTTVELEPHGLVGAAYLVADLPAREAVASLTHRRLMDELRRAARDGV